MTKSDYAFIGMLSVIIGYVLDNTEDMKRYPDEVVSAVSVPKLLQLLNTMKDEVLSDGQQTDT